MQQNQIINRSWLGKWERYQLNYLDKLSGWICGQRVHESWGKRINLLHYRLRQMTGSGWKSIWTDHRDLTWLSSVPPGSFQPNPAEIVSSIPFNCDLFSSFVSRVVSHRPGHSELSSVQPIAVCVQLKPMLAHFGCVPQYQCPLSRRPPIVLPEAIVRCNGGFQK